VCRALSEPQPELLPLPHRRVDEIVSRNGEKPDVEVARG
jgi:hypothetical protein